MYCTRIRTHFLHVLVEIHACSTTFIVIFCYLKILNWWFNHKKIKWNFADMDMRGRQRLIFRTVCSKVCYYATCHISYGHQLFCATIIYIHIYKRRKYTLFWHKTVWGHDQKYFLSPTKLKYWSIICVSNVKWQTRYSYLHHVKRNILV